MVSIGSIVIRVDDLEKQKAFWTAALDYVPRGAERGDDEGFSLLYPRDGNGPNVSLDRVRSVLPIPPRIHLDLYTDDQAGEVKRLVQRGSMGSQASRCRFRHPRRPRGQSLLRDRHEAVDHRHGHVSIRDPGGGIAGDRLFGLDRSRSDDRMGRRRYGRKRAQRTD
jgi:catechol 2,3-dioxygenase-like lactoylglutathione lyase family enzyme